MSATRSNINFDMCKLKGLSRKCGFDRWRYVFCGYHAFTGDRAFFFIELYVINPALSPDSVQCEKIEPLSGPLDTTALLVAQEPPRPHSYVAVKVGIYGKNSSVLEALYPSRDFVSSKKGISVGDGAFSLDTKSLCGSFSCDDGSASWRLNVDRLSSFFPDKVQKGMHWSVSGARALFAGEITVQGESYIVSPGSSYGYIDKIWGKAYPYPFFHLSCSHMRSIISGKVLGNSSFAVQGIYDQSFAVFAEIMAGDVPVKIARSKVKNKPHFDCVVAEDTLHWTVSASHKAYLFDIDVFCKTSNMFVRSYTCPSNPVDELQILGGSSGTGEMRLYKRVGKSLELIEHAKLEDACCEYGGIERSEIET